MKIIIDTREQLPLSFTGHETIRRKLDEGDYNIEELKDKICIERKSLQDLYQTITINHERFKKEIQRCIEKKKKIYIFIEGTLKEFYNGRQADRTERNYKFEWSPIIIRTKPITLMRIIETMVERYNIIIVECESRESMSEQIVKTIEKEKQTELM